MPSSTATAAAAASKMLVFNTKPYDREYLSKYSADLANLGLDLSFQEAKLTVETAHLAKGCTVVCAFVNDCLSAEVISVLAAQGVRLIAMRCAGFNNVDLAACRAHGIAVVRVPAYSPYAVAEHAIGLMLTLNRHLQHAWENTRNGNFTLGRQLLGFDLAGKTVAVIGTGKIGKITAKILVAFGCKVLCYDLYRDAELAAPGSGVRYVDSLDEAFAAAQIISLHAPLTEGTRHLVNAESIAKMRDNVMLINTSRGALIDTAALIDGLKSGKIGYAGLDVYEGEGPYFFEDWYRKSLPDDQLARLLSFPNVLVTAHQAFFTEEALSEISRVTFENVRAFIQGEALSNAVQQ